MRIARSPHGFFALGMLLAILGSSCARTLTPFERATSLAREHREADAIRILRDDLAHHPDDTRSRRLLVRVLALTGDLGAARAEVSELARRLGEADPVPFIELGHAYELSHLYEEALEMYDHAAEVAPEDPRGPREGGLRAARWGEAEWAAKRLGDAVARGADDVTVWHTLGLVRAKLHDLDGARTAYHACLTRDPDALECHLGLATVAVLASDAKDALAAYEAIIARRPLFAPAHLGRAWALGQMGRKEEARQSLDRAQQLGGEASSIAAQRHLLDTRSP
jgi:tetratricopeptide (TPR) repeat protein